MKLNIKSIEDRLYALRVMLGGDIPIKVLNKDIEEILENNIIFDILNDNIDYINYVSKEDIDDTIEDMILESNILKGEKRICFAIDDIFIGNELFEKYIVSLNDFGAANNVIVDLMLESPYVLENIPRDMTNVELWYGVDISEKKPTEDVLDEFLSTYVNKKDVFRLGIEKYLKSHTPSLIVASTPITILALEDIYKTTDVKCAGLIKFGNIYDFKKHGVFENKIFEDYFLKVLKETTLPLAVENSALFELVYDLVGDSKERC